ncbi:choice-of-anchor Q domain-containing protein [Anaerolineales bacterium HSG25]|nr:choice-of-anchor Q domain-containing protein [Anaerolineales bacterium HSG25]
MMLVLHAVLIVPAVYADEFIVTRTDDPTPDGCQANNCSLREAVIAANDNAASADSITFANSVSNVQLEISGRGEDESEKGDLDVKGDLTIIGNGINQTTINGLDFSTDSQNTDRIFHVITGTSKFSILHVTLQGGNVNRTTGFNGAEGGAIFHIVDNSILTVIDSKLTNNQAVLGGAIFSEGNEAIINIVNTTIDNNIGRSNGGGLNVSRVDIADVNILGSTFMNNETGGNGGAIYFFSDPNEGEKVVMNLINSTLSNNVSDEYGGGIANDGNGEVSLQNVTIADNEAEADRDGEGGGGGVAAIGKGQFKISNSILANNIDRSIEQSDDSHAPDCLITDTTLPVDSFGYNFVGNDNNCSWSWIEATTKTTDMLGKDAQGGDDPGLGDFVTPTDRPAYYELKDSKVIGAGNPDIGGALGQCAFIDQRGHSRAKDAGCDIGAYEKGSLEKVLSITTIKSGPDIIDQLGDSITYTLSVINSSLVTGSNVVVTDVIPTGSFYVTGGTQVGNMVTWDEQVLLPADQIMSVSFIVTSNQAVINDVYGTSADDFSGDGFSGVGTALAEPSLVIEKTAPSRADIGAPITYTLTVRNDGKADAINVVISDTIPAGATYITGSGGTQVGNVVRIKADNVPQGGTSLISVMFAVTATTTITNQDYWVSATEETGNKVYTATGTVKRVTIVGNPTYLPIMLKNRD